MDDNPEDMSRLMIMATQPGNDDIKIKVRDYTVENLDRADQDDEDEEAETSTKFYESDDEEKNYTKANLKNNSREEGLKLLPSFQASMIEMGKLHRESCISLDFKSEREMSFAELEEKYKHYRKTANQYEKLYGKYLEKFIIAEKERVVLVH